MEKIFTITGRNDRACRWYSFTFKAFCILVLLFPSGGLQAQPADVREGKIKAASIFHIIKFVHWPDGFFSEEDSLLKLCIVGKNPSNDYIIETLTDKKAHGRSLSVQLLEGSKFHGAAESCHVVFFGENASLEIPTVLKFIQDTSILSVSGKEDITDRGGIIQLYKEDNRLKIKINNKNAQKNKLRVSAQLLDISQVVE